MLIKDLPRQTQEEVFEILKDVGIFQVKRLLEIFGYHIKFEASERVVEPFKPFEIRVRRPH
jgi:hypothetical protein